MRIHRNFFYYPYRCQHYSYEDKSFFDSLNLPTPKYNLDIGSGSRAEQTDKIMTGIEMILQIERPYVILMQGDTNSVMAGAVTASKLHIPIGNLESGF